MSKARVFGASVVAFALAIGLYMAQTTQAGGSKLADELNKIADLLEKGDKAGAEKAAQAMAKKVEDIIEVMDLLKPRNKGGIGVGAKAGSVIPDGIEQFLLKIGRDTPTAKEMKDSAALARMAHVIGAVAEVSHAKPPEKDIGKKTKKAWAGFTKEFRESWGDMVKASKGKPAEVKTAAVKLNSSCANCHAVFK